MLCQACGTENTAGRKFCDECGIALSSPCPACGAANRPGAKFCGDCATPISGASQARAGAAAIRIDEAPRAERRLVTVLFADLVGFTALAEGRDAEAVRELLSQYFDLTSDLLGRYGGTVEKFIGDAVMAVWGTPVAREDDAERAVRSGLELVESVRTLGTDIEARVGILTGEAAVTIGATNQGMVAGDLVNTASRLQSVALPGMVLIGESTQSAVSAAIVCEPAGEQALKGKTAPVPAWRAVRVVAERGGVNRADRLEAPFVGRDDELRLLKDLLHATGREGRPRLVSVVGHAGIGKSRLVWELQKYVDGLVEDIYWHGGRSPAYGDGVTFWALGEMVRYRAGLAESDDEATVRQRIASTLEEQVAEAEERRWIEPSLLALLGAGDAPTAAGPELFAAWRAFFEHISKRGTVALVFEDLHWADPGLLDFVDHLVEYARAPILVVSMARPELIERRPNWGSGARSFTSIHLDQLPEPAMRELLSGLVPGLPASLADAVVSRAEGVPLYAVETVRMLVTDGRLVEEEGGYRPVGDLATLAVPNSLHALIAARLDALEPDDRSLLQDAAVLGQSFTTAALEAVSGVASSALEPRLRGLVRRELLTFDADPRSPERGQYAFVQALIREVAYSTLARRDRRTRHLAAARYFEAMGDDELAGVLAAHYLAAHRESTDGAEAEALAIQARIALKAAAERAGQLASHAQGVAFLESALSITSDPVERGDLLRRAGVAATHAGQHDAADEFLADAMAVYRELGDRASTAGATALLGEARLNAFRLEPAVELLLPAAEEFSDLDEASLVLLWSQLARAHFFLDQTAAAVEWADRTLAAAEPQNLVPIVTDTLVTKGTALAAGGRPIEGSAILKAGLRLAEESGLHFTVSRAHANLAYALADIDPREALEMARAGLINARRHGAESMAPTLAANLTQCAIRFGLWDEAMDEIRVTLATHQDPVDRVTIRVYEAQLVALMGGDVREVLAECRRIADEQSDPQIAAELHTTESLVALAEGRLADGVDFGLRAASEMSQNAPIAFRTAGRAASWAGDRDSARRALEGLELVQLHGRNMDASRLTLRAALAAIEGRDNESAAQYREALSLWRDLGLVWEEALCALDQAITRGLADQVAIAAVASARETFTRLDARPFLARLDSIATAPRTPDGPGVASPAAVQATGT
jgi:class 3 adenylate cyclase/tetratricopeptide (TPR) repeat protein